MTAAAEEAVPAVALQKFLFHLQGKQWEKAKALAFQSARAVLGELPLLPTAAPVLTYCCLWFASVADARSPHGRAE